MEVQGSEPLEGLGLTFENDGARRSHVLGQLREGLEELYAKLGGIPCAGVDEPR